MGLPSPHNIIHGSTKMKHFEVPKPMEEEGGSYHGSTPRLYLVIGITEPMLVVHQPPNATWPQESPRLAPWVPCVLSEQSSCGLF